MRDATETTHFAAIGRELTRLTGSACASRPERRVGGGNISECYRWESRAGALFVKLAAAAGGTALAAEAAGLEELARTHSVRVPRVLAIGQADTVPLLALEWLEPGPRSSQSERLLGEGLAALHRVTAPRYGWDRDNTIGSTPQPNTWMPDWTGFFRERRLRPQLERALAGGYARLLAAAGERLIEALPLLLAGHHPAASLLHGDLWGGNWFASRGGEPVMFDVAVYYGDAETDLAMTRLFGGFGPAFYGAYEALHPSRVGAAQRRELYNLYHVLNHANLFGGGYAAQARSMIDALLAQLR
jgi:protein-ribulosamine 3-kinase